MVSKFARESKGVGITMHKKMNVTQALFTGGFVGFILCMYYFFVPDFSYKGIVGIIISALAAFVGALIAFQWISGNEN